MYFIKQLAFLKILVKNFGLLQTLLLTVRYLFWSEI